MKADSLKIAKVFSSGGDVHYILPHFQREYAWEKENWQTLIEDVLGVYEEYEGGTEPEHFMGALVVINDGTRNGTVPAFKLVDGQQRLTTISLMLCALGRVVQHSHAGLYQKIQRLLVNLDEEGELRYKLLPTTKYGDRAAYKALIANEEPPAQLDSKIPPAFAFLHKELKYHTAQGAVDPQKLFIVLTNCLHVVFIDLDQRERPYEIFESLNHKGKALSQADLVRNYIAMRLPEDKQENAFASYWSSIETLLQEKRTVGRSRLGELTSFIRHYLALRVNSLCNERHVYERFRDRVEKEFSSPAAFMQELATLQRFAEYYDRLLRPEHEPNADVRAAYNRLNILETNTFFPFLLAARDALQSGQVTNEQFVDGLRVVENYVVRRFLVDEQTNYLNKMVPTLWREIDPANFVESLKAALASRNYPNDVKVRKSVVEDDLFDKSLPTRAKIVLVLETVNRHLSAGSDGHTVLNDAATIEHLMPQTLNPLWQNDLGDDWESTWRDCLNRLGNLTLVTQEWNSSLSNSPFGAKRSRLVNHALRLNSAYFGNIQNWNRLAIQQRGEFLAKQILEIWPAVGEPPTPNTEITPTPKAITLLGERFVTASWRDVTFYTAESIAQLLGDQFESFVEEFPKYFGKEAYKTACRQLSNGYWVYLNLSIANARVFCRSMLTKADIAEELWLLDFGPNRQAAPAAPSFRSTQEAEKTEMPQFETLAKQFDRALKASYENAVKQGYYPTRFLQMLNERGGVGTAQYLLAKPDAQQGLFRLWEVGQLDTSLEALVLLPQFESLFSEEERAMARQRLEGMGYFR